MNKIKIEFYKKCIAYIEDQLERNDITEDKKQGLKDSLEKYNDKLKLLESLKNDNDQEPKNIE